MDNAAPPSPAPAGDEVGLLRQLVRRGLATWSLSTLLLLGLGLALGLLYLTESRTGLDLFAAPQTRPILIASLALLLVTFSLYALFQQRRVQSLTRRLLEARLQGASLDSRLSEMTELFDVAARLHLHLDLAPVLETVTRRLLPALGADAASIMLLDEPAGALRCLAVAGEGMEGVRDATVPLGQGIAGRVAASRRAALIRGDEVEERYPDAAKPERRIGSALCVPMLLPEKVVGVLNVSRREGRPPFGDDDAQVLTPFAEHLAIVIQHVGEFQALGRRATALERVHRLRREFLCALNHELRNPLASVMGYAQLLRGDEGTLGEQERRGYADALASQAGRLLESVDDLHGIYSLEAGERALEPAPGSLNQLVQDSVLALGGRARRQAVTIQSHLDPELPAIRMDHPKLHLAVRHLIAGGLRVCAPESTLVLETRRGEAREGREAALFTMRIPRDSEAAIFTTDFERALGGADAGHTDALGWGLLLIRELVELHGGALRSSRSGDGAVTLELVLPVDGEADARAAA